MSASATSHSELDAFSRPLLGRDSSASEVGTSGTREASEEGGFGLEGSEAGFNSADSLKLMIPVVRSKDGASCLG